MTSSAAAPRQTKIICTLGPATSSYPMIERLAAAGMNVVRLNMSHSDHASARRIVNWVRTLNRKVPTPVAVLLDTQGPEIRTGETSTTLSLNPGDVIALTVRDETDVETRSIRVNYDQLVDALNVGDRVTVDNGLINLQVLGKQGHHLTCKVIDGGVLGSKKHVNLPGIRVNLPAITDKDAADIAFAMEQEVDFIALSFVRRAADIEELRERLGAKAQKIRVIAKIEDQEGVSNIDSIVRASDGVMVARGDLGVEIEIADLPNVQRRIVRACARHGRRVIVATHLLESMITNPIPTRAEVTDVANAVYEEVDAVMLSGETSVGKFPVRCVEQLDAIARASERFPGLGYAQELEARDNKQHLARAAVGLAETIGAAGVLVITRRGFMADYVTNCRPRNFTIYACTNSSHTRRRLVMNRGVVAHRTPFSSDSEKTLQTALRILRQREGLPEGASLVVISDVLSGIDGIQIRYL